MLDQMYYVYTHRQLATQERTREYRHTSTQHRQHTNYKVQTAAHVRTHRQTAHTTHFETAGGHGGREKGLWSPRWQTARFEVNELPREHSLVVATSLRRQPDHFDPHCCLCFFSRPTGPSIREHLVMAHCAGRRAVPLIGVDVWSSTYSPNCLLRRQLRSVAYSTRTPGSSHSRGNFDTSACSVFLICSAVVTFWPCALVFIHLPAGNQRSWWSHSSL